MLGCVCTDSSVREQSMHKIPKSPQNKFCSHCLPVGPTKPHRFSEREPTCQDSAGDSWYALDLRHVVVRKVFVTGCVEERRIAEHAPKLSGDRPVSRFHGLGADIECLPHQGAVP